MLERRGGGSKEASFTWGSPEVGGGDNFSHCLPSKENKHIRTNNILLRNRQSTEHIKYTSEIHRQQIPRAWRSPEAAAPPAPSRFGG